MKKLSQQFLTVAAMAIFTTPLHAQGIYVGGSIGQAQAEEGCDDLDDLGFVGSCDDDDTAWKATVGYQFTPNWGVEAFYADFGKAEINGAISGVPVSTEADLYGFGAAAVGTIPLTEQFSVFGKIGMLVDWDIDYSGSIGSPGTSFDFDEDGSSDVMYGIGVDYSINEKISIRAEYEYFDEIEVDFFSAGVTYKFY